MKRLLWCAAALLLALTAYLGLWPVPIDPVGWQVPAAPGYTGVHAANTKLSGLHHIALNGAVGPEHVLAGSDGKLYAAVEGGRILRMDADGSAQQTFSDTGGRPLGMAFDAAGNLVVADAIKGLLSIAADGTLTHLAPVHFANAVAVAGSGKIYVTDSSSRFAPALWGGTMDAALLDVLEQSSTGRVLEYDPATKVLRVVAKGLSLANGIALSRDEKCLFVSESGKYRVWKIAVAADELDVAVRSPQANVMFNNLPGYPDNLTRGLDGKLWLGFGGQRNDLDAMAQLPFMRKVILRLLRIMPAAPKSYGHVIAFTEDGKVVADLQDASGNSPITTGVTETADRLYINNVNGKNLGWLPR